LLYTEYNVYRVLDTSAIKVVILFVALIIEYKLLKVVSSQYRKWWDGLNPPRRRQLVLPAVFLAVASIYGLMQFKISLMVFLPVLGSLAIFSYISRKLNAHPVQRIILLLLFGAALNSTFLFWMHEKTNEGKHLQYARQLAERADTVAEFQIRLLVDQDRPAVDRLVAREFWEAQWANNAYLSSNYNFDYLPQYGDSTVQFGQPLLNGDEHMIPAYSVYFPEGYAISFTLKTNKRRSVYTANLPYKNMKDLEDYNYAVVKDGAILLSNTHDFDLHFLEARLPAIGSISELHSKGYDAKVYAHSANTFVIIGEPLSGIQTWISNFALFFAMFIAAFAFKEAVKLVVFQRSSAAFWKTLPLQNRIQGVLLTLTCLLFLIIALTTLVFLHQNNQKSAYERQLYIAETLRKEILEESEQFGWGLQDFSVLVLADLADRKLGDIDIYDASGELLTSSFASAVNSTAPKTLKPEWLQTISGNPRAILVNPGQQGTESFLRTCFGIFHEGQLEGVVVFNSYVSEIGSAQDIPVVMSKLLNVYVFLLLVSWGGGLMVVNLLTEPLILLADRLSSFKLGKQNQKLNWEGDDAIGRLIQEYNEMIDKVDGMTEELVQAEREGAWKVMAQQIAHEINNSLTPLRLQIQFLTRIFKSDQPPDMESAGRIVSGLIGQIDMLSGVATQFNLFANLESPDARPIELRSFLEQFLSEDLKRQDVHFEFQMKYSGKAESYISMDPQHLTEVLKNILSQARTAVEDIESGRIIVSLDLDGEQAVIRTTNNGKGISPELAENIFDPRFSTTSSEGGLGLPICKRIVEFYGGSLKLVSGQSEGTCFEIRFPLSVA
jgi:signal transduction histidine kinase